MRDRTGLALRLSSAALFVTGFMALSTVGSYGMPALLIPLLVLPLVPLCERLDARFVVYRSISKGITLAYFCFIPLTLIVFGPLHAVVSLTIFIQIYLMLHRKEERLYFYIYLMSFFLLLATCVQSPEPVVGLVMVLMLMSAVWAFASLRLHEDSNAPRGQASLEFMPIGARYASPESQHRHPFDFRLFLCISAISIAGVLLNALFFVSAPRLEAGVFGRPDSTLQTSGLSAEVDLRGATNLSEDMTAVMHVRFPDEPGQRYDDESALYWRTNTFARYRDSRWHRAALLNASEPNLIPVRASVRGVRFLNFTQLSVMRSYRKNFRNVRQVIYMDDVPEEGIPALDLVQYLQVHGGERNTRVKWDDTEDFTVQLLSSGGRRATYEAISEIGDPSPEKLRTVSNEYDMETQDYRLLTEEDLSERTKSLVREVTQSADTLYDKAVAIEEWLQSREFVYTLNSPSLPETNAVDYFIGVTRQGHCELFGSAMALMLRSLGVPARVVSGYRGGEWSSSDQSYTVRRNMAHLWVEVLFPEFGWVRFDPSPQRGEYSTNTYSEFARMLSSKVLQAKMFWYQQVVGFSRGFQLDTLKNLALNPIGWMIGGDSFEADIGAPAARRIGPLAWLLILLGMAAGLAVLVFFGLPHARQFRGWGVAGEYALSSDQERAVRLYRRLCNKLAKAGAELGGKTAEELREELLLFPWIDEGTATQVLQVYNEVRFGARPLSLAAYVGLRKRVGGLRHKPARG